MEFFDQLFRILTFSGIVQCVFVVLILNNRSAQKSRANLFLSILLLTLSFSIAHILFAGAVLDHLSTKVQSIGDPTYYLIPPLLWFYTSELTGNRVKWSGRLLLHFIPFLLVILFSLSFRKVGSEALLTYLHDHHRAVTIFFWTTIAVQFSWYQVQLRKKWRTYQRYVQEEVSNKEGVDITWVRFFMIVFLLINLFFIIMLFAVIHLPGGSWLHRSTAVIFSLSVFALGYKGILQKELFRKQELVNTDVVTTVAAVETNKPDPELIKRLLSYMIEKKPFLDPELTLSSLAKDLRISRSQLSVVINDGVGDNFYDFVNKYRVEEVKQLMTDPRVKNYNLLGIALEAGFKSKSTFNLIFKRFTGLTPTEYRKNLSA